MGHWESNLGGQINFYDKVTLEQQCEWSQDRGVAEVRELDWGNYTFKNTVFQKVQSFSYGR